MSESSVKNESENDLLRGIFMNNSIKIVNEWRRAWVEVKEQKMLFHEWMSFCECNETQGRLLFEEVKVMGNGLHDVDWNFEIFVSFSGYLKTAGD